MHNEQTAELPNCPSSVATKGLSTAAFTLAQAEQPIGDEPSVEAQDIEPTFQHMRTNGFRERYVRIETQKEYFAVFKIQAKILEQAIKLAKEDVENYVREVIGYGSEDYIEEDWKRLVRAAGRQKIEGGYLTLLEFFTKKHRHAIRVESQYSIQLSEAESEYFRALEVVDKRVSTLFEELQARRCDPHFLEAAQAWTNTPDSQNKTGPNRNGFSGGIIHFFEYHSARSEKRKRFKHFSQPMTVDGFIEFTDLQKEEIESAENVIIGKKPSTDNHLVLLQDAEGNRRLYILKPNRELLVTHQRPGQAILISTVVANSSVNYVERVVQASISGHDRGILNKLGSGVVCIFQN